MKGGENMGFVIGLFLGGIVGAITMAMLTVGRESDEQMMKLQEEAEGHEELH